jgi:hypothetical protein
MSFCTKCGHPRGAAALYCTGCGAPFGNALGSEALTAPVPAGPDPPEAEQPHTGQPVGGFVATQPPPAPAGRETVSAETGYGPSGGLPEHGAAEPSGPPSPVLKATAPATSRDGPTTTISVGGRRTSGGTSTSGRGGTHAMPTQPQEPSTPGPPTEYDLPATPTNWWRRRWPIAAAATLVVGCGVAAAALLITQGHHAEQAGAQHRTAVSQPPSRPATSAAATPATVPPGELAARNLNAVLVQYMTQRGNLQAAVNHISQCQNVTADANVIAGIAASRTAEIGRLSSIDWVALPNGLAMKADLTAALQHSRHADQDYQRWANGLEASCQPPAASGPSYTAAATASTQAIAAKTAFLSLWRPVAARYALASRNLLVTQL